MDPILDERDWQRLGNGDARRPPRRHHQSVVDQRRRLAILAAAVSMALFFIAMFVLTTTVYDGDQVCGSPFGAVGGRSGACEDALNGRWFWSVVLGTFSLALAALSYRWRWGRNWTEVRLTDARLEKR